MRLRLPARHASRRPHAPGLALASTRAIALLAALALAPARAARAQSVPAAATALASAEEAERVDRIFARWSTRESPGCAVGVARDGRTILERGYGMANLEYDVPITPATIFESGSVAKQFTAAVIVLLARDGKLSLDDDVRRWVPELPDYGTRITIRHLLNHTSGLRDWYTLAELAEKPAGRYVWSNESILTLAARQKELNFPPGSESLYSNTGYVTASIIAGRAGGKPLAELARERLFAPLGMTSTRHRDDFTRVVKGRATAYAPDSGGGVHTEMPFTNAHGAGGLLTTVGDLLRWNENFTTHAVGGAALAESLETRGRLTSGRRIGYALGLSVGEYRGTREVSHSGSTAGYATFLARFPDRRVSVALLCNVADIGTSALAHQVADVFLTGLEPAEPPRYASGEALSAGQLSAFAGAWFSDRTKELVRLRAADGAVRVEGAARPLVTLGPDRLAGGATEYVFASSGGKRVMRRVTVSGDTTLFTARSTAPPSAAALARYAGRYASDETDARWTISVTDSLLRIRTRDGAELAATPAFVDAFDVPPLGLVRFTRDAAGAVDGLELHAGRVRSVRLVRLGR